MEGLTKNQNFLDTLHLIATEGLPAHPVLKTYLHAYNPADVLDLENGNLAQALCADCDLDWPYRTLLTCGGSESLYLPTQSGNSKLGPLRNWSTPNVGFTDTAGIYHRTCPGASHVCSKECYVHKFVRRYSHVLASQIATYELIELAIAHGRNLRLSPAPKAGSVTRGHVSGDLHSALYVHKLIEMISYYSKAQFYFYTRSWRVDDMVESILELSALPNCRVIFSTDREIADPREYVAPDGSRPYEGLNIPTAFYMSQPEDVQYMTGNELITFRNNRKIEQRSIKLTNGYIVPVCPPENGNKKHKQITCTKCGICTP